VSQKEKCSGLMGEVPDLHVCSSDLRTQRSEATACDAVSPRIQFRVEVVRYRHVSQLLFRRPDELKMLQDSVSCVLSLGSGPVMPRAPAFEREEPEVFICLSFLGRRPESPRVQKYVRRL
jgi:hypothetical protein